MSSSAAPGFTLSAAPNLLTLSNGGAAQTLAMTLLPVNGFSSPVSVAVSGLPSGVTASPATVSLLPGQLAQWTLSASAAPVKVSTVMLTGTSGTLSASTAVSLSVTAALANAELNTTSYNFGNDLIGAALTRQVVRVTNTGAGKLQLSPAISGDSSYALVPTAPGFCGATLAAASSCSITVSYTPIGANAGAQQKAQLDLGFGNVPAATGQTVALSGSAVALPVGTVVQTINPQVALYTITLPFAGSVTVNFGTDTTYGRQTWAQATTVPGAGGTVNILVAGMLPNTAYHLQAQCTMNNGNVVADVDHTFTTGAAPIQPTLAVSATPGATPQAGVEQLTFVTGAKGLAVTDLQGGVLWTYLPPNEGTTYFVQDGKLLPNGHFLVSVGETSSFSLYTTEAANEAFVVTREIDLAGNIVKEISIGDLNDELAAAGYQLNLQAFHHTVTALPNGHWLILANTSKPFTDLPGYPGVTNVLGDVIIDLDTHLRPVWVWNEFDHFDVNRHPWNFPDWTHTNGVLYSPSDGDLIISMRDQNWVVKVDYNNGTGTGNVLWHLGEGGDFRLVNGTDPTDWDYAQHYPSLFSANSSGVFSLGLMDNGNDRQFTPGLVCGQGNAPACQYTTIPVFQMDEAAKTATFTFHQILTPSLYSNFGGNVSLLQNGNVEYDLAGVNITDSDIFEVTRENTPQTVWHMHSSLGNIYRGFRIPSLYPGVQWK